MEILIINGVEKQFEAGVPATLAELLSHLGVNTATVVAEVDGKVVERAAFGQTKLREGQNVELVRFIGGGQ